ncbi:phage tail assembly protein [Campylobacter fetus]|nr:phage tail assembly protein [Campylobacter fetus]EJU9540476.1 phage tail assembly protein [Campylobacter fetus]
MWEPTNRALEETALAGLGAGNVILTENGEKYTVVTLSDKKEVKIRHPKGSDVRFMMSGSGQNDSDLLFRLTSNLTCLSEDELENMEAKDCAMVLKEVSSFLA